MNARRHVAPAAALLLMGCAQTLTVKVLRYDVDATKESRDRYVEARRNVRSAAKALEQVSSARLALDRYKGCLRSLNALVQELLPGLPDADRTAAKTRGFAAMDAAFQPTEDALAKMESQLMALAADAPAPPFQQLPVRFSELRQQLENAQVVTDPAALGKAVAQLQRLPSPVLVERGKAVQVELDALLGDRSVSCIPADAASALSTLAPGPRASAARDAFSAAFESATIRVTAELERARTGDLIPRPYGVWQDLTDPYLMYVVAHSEHWLELVESTNVDGQGDTEYVLVFESPLDARLKTVTVDPSQVIQARLSIARKVAQAAVAAAGIATTSFGVPLPTPAATTSDSTAKAAPTDTIDYSRMTGDEQLARQRNAAEQRRIQMLKQDAARLQPIKDVDSARRALEFLKRELEAADAPPATSL